MRLARPLWQVGRQEDQGHRAARLLQRGRATKALPHCVRTKQSTAVTGERPADVEEPRRTVRVAGHETHGDSGVRDAPIPTLDREAGFFEELLGELRGGLAVERRRRLGVGLQNVRAPPAGDLDVALVEVVTDAATTQAGSR